MNYKIVIDPGHGGSDPGASGNGITEKNLTLDISKYMYDRFRELGIPVSITRLDDSTLSPTDRVNKILSFYGSDSNVIVISNHINAGGGDGAEVIYALRNSSRLSDLIGNEFQKEGQNFRKAYQRRLPSNSSKDYYFIHRNTGNTEPIIVEYGFLDSSKDDVNQLKNNYKNLSEAVVRGVLEYIGYEYQPSESDLYVVKKGDTLWSVARRYNISVDDLKRLNDLSGNMLSVGQVLKISGEPVMNNDVYIVKSGDTLYGIASRYDIKVSDLKSYNNLTGDILSIGQELYIPTGQVSEDLVGTDYNTYTVKLGDTLYSISKEYETSVSNLKRINNLTSDVLSVGQQLLVPVSEDVIDTSITNFTNYRVLSGDTLYSIASNNGVSVDELKSINNLSNDNLSVDQVLKIPVRETTIYIVKKGDTLYNISKEYNTNIDSIMKKNNLTSNLLSIGQQLIL